KMLSAAGREAATSTDGISLNPSLAYAVNGELLLDADYGDIDPSDDDIPAGLRAAVEAAGSFGPGDDGLDCGIEMRVVCALAGLNITPGELRKIRLLAAPFS